MDLNFPLILMVAVVLTGAAALFDLIILHPRRRTKLANYHNQVVDVDKSVESKILEEPWIIETSKSIFPILFIVLVLRSFLFEPFKIPSGSMIPTLEVGDYILVSKYRYGLRLPVFGNKIVPISNPKRGDVIVFKEPKNPSINFIKRVVGLPGDHIRYEDSQLFINNALVEDKLVEKKFEPFDSDFHQPLYYGIYEQTFDTGVSFKIRKDITPMIRPLKQTEWTVPENHYFVMGDNRDRSNDSRYWGFVPDELVVGKALYVWMHWPNWGELPTFSNNRAILN